MNWFMFKWKLRSIFTNNYFCDGCCDKSHHRPLSLSYISAYIGVAVGLGVHEEAITVEA